jgi:hypothetical protein
MVEYWNIGRKQPGEGRASARPRHADACPSQSRNSVSLIIPTFQLKSQASLILFHQRFRRVDRLAIAGRGL